LGLAILTFGGERKQITVLFSDLSGYTAMSERLDPEEIREVMNQILGEIASIVNKYRWVYRKIYRRCRRGFIWCAQGPRRRPGKGHPGGFGLKGGQKISFRSMSIFVLTGI
jgi:hypothetical protein